MLRRFRAAYNRPWTKSSLRYVGDAKDFWGYMVAETTGCSRPELLDDVYDYYARGEAWTLAPGSLACLKALRAMGVKLAIVSNFDTRLRPLLEDMEVSPLLNCGRRSCPMPLGLSRRGGGAHEPFVRNAAFHIGLGACLIVSIGTADYNGTAKAEILANFA